MPVMKSRTVAVLGTAAGACAALQWLGRAYGAPP